MSENLPTGDGRPVTDPPSGQEPLPPAAGPGYRPPWEETGDRHAQRVQERMERREARRAAGSTFPWLGGAVLIALGLIFLAQNLGLFFGNWNWWALFILIPAVAALASGWNQYRAAGTWHAGARGSIIGGLFLTLLALALLFSLDFGRIWPLLLILAGIGALLSAIAR